MTVDAVTAAVAVGVTTRTIQRWVADGTLPNRGKPDRIRVDLVEAQRENRRRMTRRLLPT